MKPAAYVLNQIIIVIMIGAYLLKDELNLLYQNRDVVGGFANDKYWSSTEYSHDGMWVCRFNDGSQGAYHKDQFNFYVRAVRAF